LKNKNLNDRSVTEDEKVFYTPKSILKAEMAAIVSFKFVEGDH
jgi:hypothetical protein